jgi:hypothetical protein
MVLPQEVDQVMFAVCSVYDVTRDQIMGRRRTEMLAEARQVAMVMVRRKGYTQEDTAAAFNRKDHVTIGWAEKRCREKYSWDKKFMARWDNVRSIIDSSPVSLWRKVRITLDAELPEHEDLGDVAALSKATRLAVAGSSRVRNLEVTAA